MKSSSPDRETFWQRTLRTFDGQRVRLQMRHGIFEVGEFVQIAAFEARFRRDSGALTVIDYSELLGCETAPPKSEI